LNITLPRLNVNELACPARIAEAVIVLVNKKPIKDR
jgi:hypothetical protein